MKWLVVALLAINAIVFGFVFEDQLSTKLQSAKRKRVSADGPSLRLISELPELPPLRAETEPDVDDAEEEDVELDVVNLSTEFNDVGEPSELCVTIGPIVSIPQLDELRQWFGTRANIVHAQAESVRERRFFWVYLEPSSDAQAQKNLSDLAARGVTDYMLVRRGGLKNAISLGLFRSQDSVNRRLTEMTKQGYQPVVVPQFETTENYWLSAQFVKKHADTEAVPADLIGDADLRETDCTTMAENLAGGNVNSSE